MVSNILMMHFLGGEWFRGPRHLHRGPHRVSTHGSNVPRPRNRAADRFTLRQRPVGIWRRY